VMLEWNETLAQYRLGEDMSKRDIKKAQKRTTSQIKSKQNLFK
jgi:hypothetical protein